LWRRKMTTPPPRFGEKGTRWVSYTDELPFEHRGTVTSTLYVWTSKHPRLSVDLRDLPGLVQEAGRQSLEARDLGVEQEVEAEPEETREVDDGDNFDTDG
jgi:hypothetical protein